MWDHVIMRRGAQSDASLEYACKSGATVCFSQAVIIPYLLS